MENSVICKKCDKSCSSLSNLKKHLRTYHPYDSNNTFTCECCGKVFYHEYNLRYHMKLHGDNIDLTNQPPTVMDMIIKNSKKCPLCDYSNPPKGNLLHHLFVKHEISVISEDLNFASERCFYEWKIEIEKVNHCKFIQRNSTKKSELYEVTNFFCHRSGYYVFKENLEMNEIKNINPYCPASIRLQKKNDGTCQVSYLKTHVGHDNDLVTNEALDLTSERIQPVSTSALVDNRDNNESVAARTTVSEEVKMEGDFVPKPEPEVVVQPPRGNLNIIKSESLDGEKLELIDRLTRHIRNIQSRSRLDILKKMTDKLIEVLNENNIL